MRRGAGDCKSARVRTDLSAGDGLKVGTARRAVRKLRIPQKSARTARRAVPTVARIHIPAIRQPAWCNGLS
jgi:hypothetical protein